MNDFSRIPTPSLLVELIKRSEPIITNIDPEDRLATIDLIDEKPFAIVHIGDNHNVYLTWSNEQPIFGLRLYRLLISIEVRGNDIESRSYYTHGDKLCVKAIPELEKLFVWIRTESGDIYSTARSDDEIVYQHFANVYKCFFQHKPKKFSEYVLKYYDQLIKAVWDNGLYITTEDTFKE